MSRAQATTTGAGYHHRPHQLRVDRLRPAAAISRSGARLQMQQHIQNTSPNQSTAPEPRRRERSGDKQGSKGQVQIQPAVGARVPRGLGLPGHLQMLSARSRVSRARQRVSEALHKQPKSSALDSIQSDHNRAQEGQDRDSQLGLGVQQEQADHFRDRRPLVSQTALLHAAVFNDYRRRRRRRKQQR